MGLGDPHFAIFAMQMMFGKGQQIGMAVHIQVGGEAGLVHDGGMGVMVVHQWGSMMMMHQWGRVVRIVVQISMMGMMVLIDVCVAVDDVMIDHGIAVVQEMMGLIVHYLVHMMHWLHFMDRLVADYLGRGMDMGVMHMVMAVHVVMIQVSRVAVVMINWMWHSVQMVVSTTIDHNCRAVAQMNAIGMMHIRIHEMRQMILVMMIVLQMRQQTSLSHAQQCQSADKELKRARKVS